MATVALSRLREMLAYPTGFYFSGTNTGTASDAVTDAGIARFDTTRLKNLWVLITSGNRSGESRRIASTASTTSTLVTALSGALANGDTFIIVPWDPSIGDAMLQEAMRTLYSFPTSRGTRGLFLNVPDETLMTDQRIATNPDFETAVSGGEITGWTRVNSPTLTSITTAGLFMHGDRSLRIVAGASVGRLYQAITLPIKEAVSKSVNFHCWVYATAASTARIGVSFDNGSTFTYSDYHGGADEWEDLDKDVSIPADADSVRVYLEVAANGTGHFDLTRAWCDDITVYTLPTSIIGGPYSVLYQVYEDKPSGNSSGDYLPYRSGVAAGRILRLEGVGRLTVPTTASGTVEVDENRAELIIAQAAIYLYQNPGNTDVGDAAERARRVAFWQQRVAELKESPGIAMHFPSSDLRRYWDIPPRDTRQLILVR